jgi:2-succinyl-6-hydroxy-2,4-cyclohexadiene-1-carboxylate synthase
MPILALHGFTGRGSDFAPFAELCGNEWHTPDLPGHGPEPQLDCSPEATVDFIQQAANNKQPLTTLLGYSLGARAALLHATTYPDTWDALILISPSPGIEAESERMARAQVDAKLARRIEHRGAPAFIEFWQHTPMIRSQQNIRPDWREAMQRNRLEHTAQGLATSLRQFGQGSCPNLWPELNKLTMPVLLLSGELDAKYCAIAQRMERTLSTLHSPLISHSVIDGVGHMPHLESPEATAAAINAFVARVSA